MSALAGLLILAVIILIIVAAAIYIVCMLSPAPIPPPFANLICALIALIGLIVWAAYALPAFNAGFHARC
ncbi:MAG TPA: hypothetical protein VGH15_05805 [Caulobacteraceae bacterium]|jgi:hypothetical protein